MNETTTTTEEITMSDDTEFRVWIGCLACYNNGVLVGNWYPASEAGEVATKALHARNHIDTDDQGYVRGEELYGPHEELWVMDLDNAPRGYYHEMSPYEAQQIAEAFDEVEEALSGEGYAEAYFAWVADHYGQPPASEIADYLSDFEDRFRGVYESFRDYADEVADEQLGVPMTPCPGSVWESAMRELGPTLEFAIQHFDYAGHARDLEMSHSTYAVTGGVAVFMDY